MHSQAIAPALHCPVMIPSLRRSFNSRYKPEKYAELLALLAERCGVPIGFRVSETPCFLPAELLTRMAAEGKELIRQLAGNAEYRARSGVDSGGVAAEAGGVAGLPVSVCVSAGAGADVHGCVRVAGGIALSAGRSGCSFVFEPAAEGDCGGAGP